MISVVGELRLMSNRGVTMVAILGECKRGVFLLAIRGRRSFDSLKIQSDVSSPPQVKKIS